MESTDDAGLHAPDRPGMGRAHDAIWLDPGAHVTLLRHALKWTVLGGVVGVLAGLGSAGLLKSLTWATDTRIDHPNLVFGLPLAGLAVGLAYHYVGGRSGGGNSLIIDEIHEAKGGVPRRMAPLIYVFTVVAHIVGASVGREGTAVQMAGSLTDAFARLIRVSAADRRLLLIASIAGGFGSVFGVPLAGTVFALEVQSVGRIRFDALVPSFVASVTGVLVVRGLGVHHEAMPAIDVHIDATLLAKVALAGVAFGITAVVFADLTHAIKRVSARIVAWPPARPFLGGLAVLLLTGLLSDRAYLGLSSPLIAASLAGGVGVAAGAFALKLLFTSLSLGSGFQGGEVTPLFVIGATLGVSLARVLDVPTPLLAAVGLAAVFAGASNTPLACTVMAVELFGGGIAVPAATACIVAFVVSTERGIYGTQRVDTRQIPRSGP